MTVTLPKSALALAIALFSGGVFAEGAVANAPPDVTVKTPAAPAFDAKAWLEKAIATLNQSQSSSGLQWTLRQYQAQKNGATAIVDADLSGYFGRPAVVPIQLAISQNVLLAAKGVSAQIIATTDIAPKTLAEWLALPGDDATVGQYFLTQWPEHTSATIDINTDGSVFISSVVQPFSGSYLENGKQIHYDFKGFYRNVTSSQWAPFAPYQGDLQFKGADFSFKTDKASPEDQGRSLKISLSPWKFQDSLKPNGDLKGEGSAFAFQARESQGEDNPSKTVDVDIAQFTLNGEKLRFDPAISEALGQITAAAQNLHIKVKNGPQSWDFTFPRLSYEQKTSQNQGFYRQTAAFDLHFGQELSDFIHQLSGNVLAPESFKATVDINRLSASLVQALNRFIKGYHPEKQGENQTSPALKNLYQALAKDSGQGLSFSTGAALNLRDKTAIKTQATARFSDNAGDIQALLEAFFSPENQNAVVDKYLKKGTFKADYQLSVPKALFEQLRVNLPPKIQQAFQLNGGVYTFGSDLAKKSAENAPAQTPAK